MNIIPGTRLRDYRNKTSPSYNGASALGDQIKSAMSCIFASSKYYKQAKASALEISAPLGSQFLNRNRKVQHIQLSKSDQTAMKQTNDKPLAKIISHKRTPTDAIADYLKVSQLVNKNQYISIPVLQFIRNKCPKQVFLSMAKQYVPNWKPEYSVIELTQLLYNPRLDSIKHVEDFTLSTFFYACVGSDEFRVDFLFQYFNRRLLNYDIQCVLIDHNHIRPRLSMKPGNVFELRPPDVTNIDDVRKLIQEINTKSLKKDPLYSGTHFFFADLTLQAVESADFLHRQVLHYPLLQYFITLMTGILGDGQSAVFKLCGSFKHKTFEMLYMLKLMFNGKVSFNKTICTNPFTPDVYLICEHYNKVNGNLIHEYLLENYHLLAQHGDEKFLLDPRKLFKQDLHTNIKSYNENIIKRGIQQYLNDFKLNSNTEYYPSKAKLLEKQIKYAPGLESLVGQMVRMPDAPAPTAMEDESAKKAETKEDGKRDDRQGTSGGKRSAFPMSMYSKKKQQQQSGGGNREKKQE